MIGKRLKKKNHVEKLIDYNDFVRFREERQEIIKVSHDLILESLRIELEKSHRDWTNLIPV